MTELNALLDDYGLPPVADRTATPVDVSRLFFTTIGNRVETVQRFEKPTIQKHAHQIVLFCSR
jgi:hypothetical protein